MRRMREPETATFSCPFSTGRVRVTVELKMSGTATRGEGGEKASRTIASGFEREHRPQIDNRDLAEEALLMQTMSFFCGASDREKGRTCPLFLHFAKSCSLILTHPPSSTSSSQLASSLQ